MNTHTPEIVETKELTDDQVAYLIRCCGDPSTDSWHTISVLCPNHEEQLVDRKATVAAKHEAKVAWRQKRQADANDLAAHVSPSACGKVTVPAEGEGQ
jgi:hypothetical protein